MTLGEAPSMDRRDDRWHSWSHRVRVMNFVNA